MTTDEKQHPVIFVEDNPRDREYLVTALCRYSLHIAESGDQALALVHKYPDAYLISDLQLPGMTGVDLSRAVWELNSTARIIIWSQYSDEVYLRAFGRIVPPEALYGFVLKNNSSQLLNRAVSSVFDDEQCWIDPQIRPIRARSQSAENNISDIEYEVLVDIALGMTDSLIAKRRFLSRRGVQSRLKSLYEKLDLDRATIDEGTNPRTRAVALALSRGLINPYELEKAELALQVWRKAEVDIATDQ